MQRGDAREADAGVCGGNVVDQICGTHEVADAPAGAVEIFACGTDCEGSRCDSGGEGGDASERGERETVVNLMLGSVGIGGFVQTACQSEKVRY